jgi:hypothetical protein
MWELENVGCISYGVVADEMHETRAWMVGVQSWFMNR